MTLTLGTGITLNTSPEQWNNLIIKITHKIQQNLTKNYLLKSKINSMKIISTKEKTIKHIHLQKFYINWIKNIVFQDSNIQVGKNNAIQDNSYNKNKFF